MILLFQFLPAILLNGHNWSFSGGRSISLGKWTLSTKYPLKPEILELYSQNMDNKHFKNVTPYKQISEVFLCAVQTTTVYDILLVICQQKD